MDLKGASELFSALVDVDQTESGLRGWQLHPCTVVLQFEDEVIGHHDSHHISRCPSVLAGVGETLPHDSENVVAHVLGNGVVNGSLEPRLGAAPEASGHFLAEMHDRLAQSAGKGRVSQLEDSRANLGDGVVEFVDRLRDPLYYQVALGQPGSTLEAHADCIDALNDAVMEASSDSIPLVENTHDPAPGVEPGVLEGDSRCESEGFGERFVRVGELSRAFLIGQVEVAVNVVS